MTLPRGIYINPYEMVPKATVDVTYITFGSKQRNKIVNMRS